VAIFPYQNETANGNKSDALHNASILTLKPNSPDSSVSNGLQTENWNQKLSTDGGPRNTKRGTASSLTYMTT